MQLAGVPEQRKLLATQTGLLYEVRQHLNSAEKRSMTWMVFAAEMTKALATPIAVLLALLLFRDGIREVFSSLAFLIRERKFKTSFGRASLETSTKREEEVRTEIARTVAPESTSRAEVPELVEARKFILRDSAGKARALIGFGGAKDEAESQDPIIALFDAKEKPRILIRVDEDYGAMVLAQTEQDQSVAMFASNRFAPHFALLDKDGKIHTHLDDTSLSLASNSILLHVPEEPEESPFMIFSDKNKRQTLKLP